MKLFTTLLFCIMFAVPASAQQPVLPVTSLGVYCDFGTHDDTPGWNAINDAVDAGIYAFGTTFQWPYGTCVFKTKPRMMASNIKFEGSPLGTVLVRGYQPGAALPIASVINNGSGGCRVWYTPPTSLSGTIGIFGNTSSPEVNGQWNYTQITTSAIDLTGCVFAHSSGPSGTILTAPNEPFIELGPQSSADCVGFTPTINPWKCGNSQIFNNFTILSGAGTWGGIGFDMGSYNFGGGYGYVYNSKADHLFVSISGSSGWWIAHRNNGCQSPGSPFGAFEGNRDDTVSNSSFYSGASGYMTVAIYCTVAARYPNIAVLQATGIPIIGDLVFGGILGIPNYDTIMNGSTVNSVVHQPYSTLSHLSMGNVQNVIFVDNTDVGNFVTAGECTGVTPQMLGINNVVMCNSNIYASSTYVIRSGLSGGVQLKPGATAWVPYP